MSRTRRADNTGMHSIVNGPKQLRSTCPICKKTRKLQCVSKSGYACSACIKEFDLEPYYSPLEKEGNPPPIVWLRRKRTSHNF